MIRKPILILHPRSVLTGKGIADYTSQHIKGMKICIMAINSCVKSNNFREMVIGRIAS